MYLLSSYCHIQTAYKLHDIDLNWSHIKYTVSECVYGLVLPCPGGVIVMVCAVNSSSKYRVSVSEVTWGLNGGTSCWRAEETQTYQHISTVNPFDKTCPPDDNLHLF